jgi:DNA-binding response OmpR family regulator
MAKRHRILLIDDSKETVLGLKAYLGKKYHVLTAYNGRDGIKKYDQNESRIDLILTDLILPDARGSYLISLFKQKTPEKPVIAMTGWEGDPAEEFETNSIADLVLKKPFELEELDQAIEKFLHPARIAS